MGKNINIVIKKFLPGAEPKLLSVHKGELNRVLIFNDSKLEYALRIKKKPFPLANLVFEKDFLDALNKEDLPITIPKIFPGEFGLPYIEDLENFYTLMSRVPGEQRFKAWYESHLFSDEDVRQGFELLGSLHNIYRRIKIEDRKASPSVYDLLDTFERRFGEPQLPEGQFIKFVRAENEFIKKSIERVRKGLDDSNYKDIPLFPVHYDLNYTNVLWGSNKIVSLLDFDWAQFSTLEFDFAQTCKLVCGSFSITGSSNLYNNGRMKIAMMAYNKKSNVKIHGGDSLHALLDAGSLFLAHWALDTYAREKINEKYYFSFFLDGLSRLHQKIIW
jgi:Ser/Thr protein kinase RdoA (MazF antagonist)